MKKHNIFKIVVTIIILIVFLIVGYKAYNYFKLQKSIDTSIEELTEEQKLEDFEFLYNTIVENYPFLEVNKRKYGVDWVANKDKYIEMIKENDDFEGTLKYILGDLNNSHTHMISKDFLEFQLKFYSEMDSETINLLRIQFSREVLIDPLVINRYDIKDTYNTNSDISESNLQTFDNAIVSDIVAGKVASIYIPSMINYFAMEKDKLLISNYLEDIKNYQALVIDIRCNGGGSEGYWKGFLLPQILKENKQSTEYLFYKESDFINSYLKTDEDFNIQKIEDLDLSTLINLPRDISNDFKYYIKQESIIKPSEDSINFEGNIYLLVDENVFSASESLAAFVKETGFATIIGEKTKGDGIGTEPLYAMLPNSGLVMRFPISLGTISDGTINEEYPTIPDYTISKPTKLPQEFIESDNCIKKVLELEGIDMKEVK